MYVVRSHHYILSLLRLQYGVNFRSPVSSGAFVRYVLLHFCWENVVFCSGQHKLGGGLRGLLLLLLRFFLFFLASEALAAGPLAMAVRVAVVAFSLGAARRTRASSWGVGALGID